MKSNGHLLLIRHYTNLWTYYRTWPYHWFWPYCQISGGFHRILQWVWLVNRERLLLQTPGPVPLGTCICSNVETNLSCACHVFGLYISNIPWYMYFYFASVDVEANIQLENNMLDTKTLYGSRCYSPIQVFLQRNRIIFRRMPMRISVDIHIYTIYTQRNCN